MTDDHDDRDPLRAAFQDHRRAPRDIVPRSPGGVDDLRALAGTTQTIRHYQLTEHGITEHVEKLEITRPITLKENRS